MAASNVAQEAVATYVGQKVACVKWRPTPLGSLEEPTQFAFGSWDDDRNKVCVWRTGVRGDGGFWGERSNVVREPQIEAEVEHDGNVTDIEFMDAERLVVASSTGSVCIMKHRTTSHTIDVIHPWERPHFHSRRDSLASCTAVSVNPPDVATVGEDGKINVLRLERRDPLLTLEADSLTMTCITCVRQSELLTGSVGGQLKLWDIRQPTNHPAKIFLLVGEPVALHCLDQHPNQHHLLATGSEDGVLSVWDTRQECSPVGQREAHTSSIWTVKFHPTCPDNLFTSSEDGSVWHWDATTRSTTMMMGTPGDHIGIGITAGSGTSYSPWMLDDSTRAEILATNLIPWHRLPVHSLDIQMRHLVCGTDSEAIILMNDLSIR